MDKAQDEFCNYLDWKVSLEDKNKILPLFHNCNLDDLKSYLRKEKIELEDCEIFPKEKCYAFYGASRYKKPGEDEKTGLSRRINGKAPSCLILNTQNVENIYRIYPFDTGSACNPSYTKRAVPYEPEDIKNRLHIGDKHLRVNKVIFHFFNTLEDYVDGNLAINNQGEISGYLSIPKEISSFVEIETLHKTQSSGDKREICTEFIFNKPVPLNPDVLEGFIANTILLPEIKQNLIDMSTKYDLSGLEKKFFPSKDILTLECYQKIEDFSINYSKTKLNM